MVPRKDKEFFFQLSEHSVVRKRDCKKKHGIINYDIWRSSKPYF